MKTRYFSPVLCFLIFTVNIISQQFNIKVNAVDYDGIYFLDNNFGTTYTKESLYVTVTPGVHSLNTGATVGDAYINFTVDSVGKVTYLSPPGAVYLDDNTITFKTAEIIIDPEKYEGNYRLSFLKTASWSKNSYKIIKNMMYNLSNGSGAVCEGNIFNYFYFL